MKFSIKFDNIKPRWSIIHIEGSQVIALKKYCIYFSEDGFSQSKIDFLKKILSGILSVCQTVWMQIRPDGLSGLIWVQTVCKGYQHRTLASKELFFTGWSSMRNYFMPISTIFTWKGPYIYILHT